MKADVYLASRSGGRPSRDALANAWQFFVSSGGFVGGETLAVEVFNKALDAGMSVTITDNRDGTVSLKRAMRLSR